jgi:hypothetical protein
MDRVSIAELEYEISRLKEYLQDPHKLWSSLLIEKYPPVIHRLSLKLSITRTLVLHRLFKCQNTHAYMHSHSWPFAIKVIEGGYEMGVGFSSRRNVTPSVTYTTYVGAGNSYEMCSSDVWHYTKILEPVQESYSIMLIGPRQRPRYAQNNFPLNVEQRAAIFTFFKSYSERL